MISTYTYCRSGDLKTLKKPFTQTNCITSLAINFLKRLCGNRSCLKYRISILNYWYIKLQKIENKEIVRFYDNVITLPENCIKILTVVVSLNTDCEVNTFYIDI